MGERDLLMQVYADRNRAVQLCAALARVCGYPVGFAGDPDEPEWPVLMIELPTGQISWHLPKDEIVMKLEDLGMPWDGHTNEEKASRIVKFIVANS